MDIIKINHILGFYNDRKQRFFIEIDDLST